MTKPKWGSCGICGNGGPTVPGARYACGLPAVKQANPRSELTCPFAVPDTRMKPADVHRASQLLIDYATLEHEIESLKSKHLQVMFGGHYRSDEETQEAARIGLLDLWNQKRAVIRVQLAQLGVESPDA